MMRFARKAALLVAFSLLTSAATASAECAWVLWQEISGMSDRGGYSSELGVSLASSSEQECRRAAAEQLRTRGTMLRQPGPNKKTPEVKVEGSVRHAHVHWRLVELPLRVPPRHRGPARAEGEVNAT
jgi:hypothetical protein